MSQYHPPRPCAEAGCSAITHGQTGYCAKHVNQKVNRRYHTASVQVVRREPGACQHRWSIEEPNGPTSRGVCKLCHEVREFRNSFEDDLTAPVAVSDRTWVWK